MKHKPEKESFGNLSSPTSKIFMLLNFSDFRLPRCWTLPALWYARPTPSPSHSFAALVPIMLCVFCPCTLAPLNDACVILSLSTTTTRLESRVGPVKKPAALLLFLGRSVVVTHFHESAMSLAPLYTHVATNIHFVSMGVKSKKKERKIWSQSGD